MLFSFLPLFAQKKRALQRAIAEGIAQGKEHVWDPEMVAFPATKDFGRSYEAEDAFSHSTLQGEGRLQPHRSGKARDVWG